MTAFATSAFDTPATNEHRRIIVIDDSMVTRVLLTQVFAQEPDFEVCAVFDRAARALDWLGANRCDLILLDLQMPGRSGLAALPDLIAAGGNARIVIVSAIAAEGASATLQALSLGAADVVTKPHAGPIGRRFGLDLLARLRGLSVDPLPSPARSSLLVIRDAPETPVACVAIGASTGGIYALTRLLAALPQEFDAPILVTQHLPPPFMPFFADQLATIAGRPSHVAHDGQALQRRTILVAPGDAHLGLTGTGASVRVSLQSHASESRCLPSVDPMFEGLAGAFGANGVGIVLSGMGRDGSAGAAQLAAAGGTLLVQDAESATIWGMPGSVARAGLASLVAPPERLAGHLAWRGSAL
jgi:two-component system, chemotaxis family, protein-glutamate methylesterase/glutaminase